ncbi:hypothetical protein [Pedobacter sp. Hv1]|uniref:hypothetical protein n=1 Tax=Pedobacter sp. Hv1 TaxID=1740090 RepID=UPI0006D8B982|nr:hypothetical protein [Pedobacter sp. Hv1]KQB99813.1 hypothetical protein AQF98_14950 [Pedobacter sp. Hv1]
MKVKFINSYTLASYFVLGTFIIGVINIFIHGLEDLADVILAVVILLLRYFSFVLVKRSFNWSKYLLVLLLARSVYRLWYICNLPGTDFLGVFMMILQIIFTILALSLITKVPANIYKKRTRI